MRKRSSVRNGQCGTQILELALVLPLLCLLLVFVLEGGEFTRTHTVLNNTAREGARLLASGRQNQCPTCAMDTAFPNSCKSTVDPFKGVAQAMCTYITLEDANRPVGARINTDNVTMTITQTKLPSGATPGVMMTVSNVQVSYPYSFMYIPGMSPGLINLKAQAQFEQF
jgi:Flp pilus assembly protein TadG